MAVGVLLLVVQELFLSVLRCFLFSYPNVVNKGGKVEADPNCVNLENRRRREFSKLKMTDILSVTVLGCS